MNFWKNPYRIAYWAREGYKIIILYHLFLPVKVWQRPLMSMPLYFATGEDYDPFSNVTYHSTSCINGVCTEKQKFKNGTEIETTYIDPDFKPKD